MTQHQQAPSPVRSPEPPKSRLAVIESGGVLLVLVAAVVVLAAWHLTQGTSGLGLADIVRWALSGFAESATADIVTGSRLPRLLAGVTVGFALGVAGALFQSLARNALASPDTLGVTAGSFFAVAAVAAFGLAVPLWASGLTALVGGLAAAALVVTLAGAGVSTTRLILAGSAVALAIQSGTAALLILFEEQTTGLYAWGSGSLSQLGLTAFQQAAPVVVAATLIALMLARRLDLMSLGDDAAAALGVPVRSSRLWVTLLAVVLTAASVTLAGPLGFVGLCAPVAVRLLATRITGLQRHLVLLPAAGLAGAIVVLGADAVMRAVLGPEPALAVPTGVTTTLLGALVMVALARTGRDAGPTRQPPTGRGRLAGHWSTVMCILGVAVAVVVVAGLLGGHTWLRLGDIVEWLRGDGLPLVQFALDERAPRVTAAIAAGAALALAGTAVQAVCRNPLAEPGILGITGGAGVGAVVVVTGGLTTAPTSSTMLLAATIGALIAFGLVYGLSWRGGMAADRLVLIGIGLWYGSTALTTFMLVRSNPWDTPRIFTWLSGSTYGRTWDQVVPVLVALVVIVPLALLASRHLDLMSADDDTPRIVGVSLERVRLAVLAAAAAVAAMSVSAVGVVLFVGLVAPHAARMLVGGLHARVIPVAMLLGALLMGVADLVGRSVIAPAQLPVGLVAAVIGAPYFVWLLARSRW